MVNYISLYHRIYSLILQEFQKMYRVSKKNGQMFNEPFKGAGRSADLKINKSAPLFLNHHTFSNTEQIYTK